MNETKVLYIAGWGRSGSTILGNVMGQLDGFFFAGELRFLWDRIVEDRICGCGTPLRDCEVWNEVLNTAFGGMDQIDVHELIRLRQSGTRTRHIPLMLSSLGRSVIMSRLRAYPVRLKELYRSIQSSTGAKVIVDSSKWPMYGHVLRTIPGIDLYVIHLIRDPRAVAFSWQRKKIQPDSENIDYLPRYSPARVALMWNTWNAALEVFGKHSSERFLLVRYEQFVDKPQQTVKDILNCLDEKVDSLPFVGRHSVDLGISHTISGNPIRFQTGPVELRLDDEWKTEMKRSNMLVVTMLTWPLLTRYGYHRLGGT